MNIMHLKYAVEVAETKSISKAAENLFMGQPNLSRAIKELEESLGITIFKRSSKGIDITPEGDEFLSYARRIIMQIDEVEQMYTDGKQVKQRFSICVPRASYISAAFSEFSKKIDLSSPAEFFYKETNSMRAINNILKDDYSLGIIRYQKIYDKKFKTMFEEKNIVSQVITEFSYVLLVSRESPLVNCSNIDGETLKDYIEITHADPYVPSMPLIDVRKSEFSHIVDKHIFVFERASQFDLLMNVPKTFMWVSPIPQSICNKYNLVQLKFKVNRAYRDVLIYRNGYRLSALDDEFISCVVDAKRKYIDAMQ